jgi:8-oxo-dGTP diphosphatase
MRETVRAVIIRDEQILLMQRNKHGDIYYSLIGGAIEAGEDPAVAIVREVVEETCLQVKPGSVKLTFQYDAGAPYGIQQVYVCEVEGDDEPRIADKTPEAESNAQGENLYMPMWVPLNQLTLLPFRPMPLGQAIVDAVKYGFPEGVKTL